MIVKKDVKIKEDMKVTIMTDSDRKTYKHPIA